MVGTSRRVSQFRPSYTTTAFLYVIFLLSATTTFVLRPVQRNLSLIASAMFFVKPSTLLVAFRIPEIVLFSVFQLFQPLYILHDVWYSL